MSKSICNNMKFEVVDARVFKKARMLRKQVRQQKAVWSK